MQFLSPFYDFLKLNADKCLLFIVLILGLFFIVKLKNSFSRKGSIGTTNNWFSWDEFYEYQKNNSSDKR